MMNGSHGPGNNCNTFLVEESSVVSTFHSQTHDEILSCSVQIHWDHHFVFFGVFVFYFLPGHNHFGEIAANFFVFSEWNNHILIIPMAAFNFHSSSQKTFFIDFLVISNFHSKLQFFERPSISLCDELSGCCHVSLREEESTKPNTTVLIICSCNQLIELFKSALKIDNIVGQGDCWIDGEVHPRFWNSISMDILSKFSQNIGGKDFPVAEILNIN